MLNNQELIEILSKLPNNAKIYREADHGQQPEGDPSISVGVFLGENFPYSPNDDSHINWMDVSNVHEDKFHLINCILIG